MTFLCSVKSLIKSACSGSLPYFYEIFESSSSSSSSIWRTEFSMNWIIVYFDKLLILRCKAVAQEFFPPLFLRFSLCFSCFGRSITLKFGEGEKEKLDFGKQFKCSISGVSPPCPVYDRQLLFKISVLFLSINLNWE